MASISLQFFLCWLPPAFPGPPGLLLALPWAPCQSITLPCVPWASLGFFWLFPGLPWDPLGFPGVPGCISNRQAQIEILEKTGSSSEAQMGAGKGFGFEAELI